MNLFKTYTEASSFKYTNDEYIDEIIEHFEKVDIEEDIKNFDANINVYNLTFFAWSILDLQLHVQTLWKKVKDNKYKFWKAELQYGSSTVPEGFEKALNADLKDYFAKTTITRGNG